MPKFLVDENLSPLLARWLRGLGYEVRAVRDAGLRGKSDEEIVHWLREHAHVLITSDLDFGEFFYWGSFGAFGVIILRSKSQGVDSFKGILTHLHQEKVLKDERLSNSLLVAAEKEYRWRRFLP